MIFFQHKKYFYNKEILGRPQKVVVNKMRERVFFVEVLSSREFFGYTRDPSYASFRRTSIILEWRRHRLFPARLSAACEKPAPIIFIPRLTMARSRAAGIRSNFESLNRTESKARYGGDDRTSANERTSTDTRATRTRD